MAIFGLFLPAIVSVCFPSENVVGQDDIHDVVFICPACGTEETGVVYVGESALGISVVFGTDRLRWSLEAKSDIFTSMAAGGGEEHVPAGTVRIVFAQLVPAFDPGESMIVARTNSTDMGGKAISYEFNLSILCERAMEVVDVVSPTGYDTPVIISVRTRIKADELMVRFDADGDIEVMTEDLMITTPFVGTHEFQSFIVEDRSSPDPRGLAYHIVLMSGGRSVEITGDILVPAQWHVDGASYRTVNEDAYPAALIVCLVTIMVVFNYVYYIHRVLRSPTK